MQTKIKSLKEIFSTLDKERSKGRTIVQCHGVFDLLHPGHIRHFQEAKKLGDILVVTITPDRFVNKGPGRPAFNEMLRLESLASLSFVDFVVLNDSPDAVSCIQKIRPDIYVKGKEYKNPKDDVTGKISVEKEAVKEANGRIHYTDDIVFSSSSLLNRYFDAMPLKVQQFLRQMKEKYTLNDLLQKIEDLQNLRVLIVGDAIIDEYQYVEPLGQSAKGLHMTACCKDKETFLGGSLIIANHVAEFTPNVHLLTAIGSKCSYEPFINHSLNTKVQTEFVKTQKKQTLIKKRYVLRDGKTLSKLFETYSSNERLLDEKQTDYVVKFIEQNGKNYDVIIVCDFGNGFTNMLITDVISKSPTFLAINTQTNSGNRGFNVVTHYKRADFISLNEPELRLAAHDRQSSVEGIAEDILQFMHAKAISVTRGVNGIYCRNSTGCSQEIPALTSNVIDRLGAGDSYLSLASLCAAKNYSLDISGFLGSIAAALDVQIVGNKEAVHKAALCKFLTRLMK